MTVTRSVQGIKQAIVTPWRRAALAALLLLSLLSAAALQAQPVPGQGRIPPQNNLLQEQLDERDAQDARTRISRRQASELARDTFSGRVLSIRLDDGHWRVRMDQEGTVFNVLVDAATGDVARAAD